MANTPCRLWHSAQAARAVPLSDSGSDDHALQRARCLAQALIPPSTRRQQRGVLLCGALTPRQTAHHMNVEQLGKMRLFRPRNHMLNRKETSAFNRGPAHTGQNPDTLLV